MVDIVALDSSIPANNQKIIEVYNKMRQDQLQVNKDYQRKLVWKKSHKVNFIDTILRNYPFPEVYFSPGVLDQEKLILIDEIVDGQQRLQTIRDYIEGTDIFALAGALAVPKFGELTVPQKSAFLNYEISVRYLKNMTPEQVREIFQRINKTDYALNATERINAQWGDSEFVLFAKQLIEEDFESDSVQYRIEPKIRKEFVDFFHGGEEQDEGVFSDADMSRMFALQYIMTLIVTMDNYTYFARNDRIRVYIEGYNEYFHRGEPVQQELLAVVRFIKSLNINRDSRWYKKANLFSLIVELGNSDLSSIDVEAFSLALVYFDYRATLFEIKFADAEKDLTPEEIQYLAYAREAVNQKAAREFRGGFIQGLIGESVIAG